MRTTVSSTIPLYNALMKAGAPEEDARSAAESVAGADQVATKSDTARIDQQMATKEDVARIEGRLNLLQWMMGVVLAFLVAISARLFFMP